jgi:RNA polymerase sigma-70 factor (ECF subfamily)
MPPQNPEQARWFAEEVSPHEPALRAWLQKQYPNLSDVDDVVQESFLRLLSAREKTCIGCVRAYLFAIARNAALGVFRKQKIFSDVTIDELETSCILEGSTDVVETASTHQEFAFAIEAIDALPSRCREIVILRAVQGLPYQEIAQRLGLSVQTVRVQVARGMKKCAEFLRERGINGRSGHAAG